MKTKHGTTNYKALRPFIAAVNSNGGKKGDCRVTLKEIRAGWKPELPNSVAIAYC